MIIQDKLVKELNDAKNAVEEYVYDLRDKLCGIFEKYITEDVSAAYNFHSGIVNTRRCAKQMIYNFIYIFSCAD